jgi:hypothetical protein
VSVGRPEKVCPVCDRSDVEFGPNRARRDGLQAQCRECLNRIQRVSRRRPAERARCRAQRVRQQGVLRDFVRNYLLAHPCVDCGEADLRLLEFDHVRGEKRAAVTSMVNWGFSLAMVEAEVEKCAVRCVRCHRLRHRGQPPPLMNRGRVSAPIAVGSTLAVARTGNRTATVLLPPTSPWAVEAIVTVSE